MIQDLKKWLKKKQKPTKLGGNIRCVEAEALIKHLQRNYIITKKVKS